VVIADEGHRSHYDFIDGYARFMWDGLPRASFIGFTGTPIAKADANTRPVFGDYISVYDSQRAVEDHATVPIYYEGRLANLELVQNEKPEINPEFEEVMAGEVVERREKLKSKRPRAQVLRASGVKAMSSLGFNAGAGANEGANVSPRQHAGADGSESGWSVPIGKIDP